jgi:hypothetical protein
MVEDITPSTNQAANMYGFLGTKFCPEGQNRKRPLVLALALTIGANKLHAPLLFLLSNTA